MDESQKRVSVSFKIQLIIILVSIVGVVFGVISHNKAEQFLAPEVVQTFRTDLYMQVTIQLVVNIVAGIFIYQFLTSSLNKLVDVVKELSEKNLQVDVPFHEKNDEIGDISRAVEVLKRRSIEAEELKASQFDQQVAKEKRMERIEEITHKFDDEIDVFFKALLDATNNLQDTSGSLASAAEEGSAQSSSLKAATEEATSNVNTVASAAEELSCSINEINQQVVRSSSITNSAVEEANNAVNTVNGLLQSAEKVGSITELINEIAEQINLLALNATIESARAGEAGKGFAVVANEVKNLASQTTKAIGDIESHINSIQDATKNSAGVIEGVGKTISEINTIAKTIAEAIEEQGSATQEIAKSIQNAAHSTLESSNVVSSVAEASNQTGKAATDLKLAADRIAEESRTLNNEIEEFLSDIKAA